MNKNKILSNWVDNLTCELAPSEINSHKKNLSNLFPLGCKIYLVHLPNRSIQNTFDAAQKLLDLGMNPVIHIGAKNLKDEQDLKKILHFMMKANLKEVLLIGGGLQVEKGKFKMVMDLLNTGLFQDYGITKFGIAGHPEKHHFASAEKIQQGYREKYEYFRSHNLDFYMITQFTFSVTALLNLVSYFQKNDLNIPIRIGIVGKCGFVKLIKYAIICGIGNSINFLKKESSNIRKIRQGYLPETLLLSFLDELMKTPQKYEPIQGIHLFPFGNLKETMVYLDELKRRY